MAWYSVVKTINGCQYLYLQSTRREGGRVKTRNRYVGPLKAAAPYSPEPRAVETIAHDLEEARVRRDILADTVRNHPTRFFLKLRGNLAKQNIGGDSFAELNAQAMENKHGRGRRHELLKHLDTHLSERGFADFDELDAAVEQYFKTKEQLDAARRALAKLRKEDRYARAYHRALGTRLDEESIIRPVAEPKPKPVHAPKPKPQKLARDIKLAPIRRKKALRRRFARIDMRDVFQPQMTALRKARREWKKRSRFRRLIAFRDRAKLKWLEQQREGNERRFRIALGKRLNLRKPLKRPKRRHRSPYLYSK